MKCETIEAARWEAQATTKRLRTLEEKIHTLLDASSLDDKLQVGPCIGVRIGESGASASEEVLMVTSLPSAKLRPAIGRYIGRDSAPPRRDFLDDEEWYEARKKWWKDRAEAIDGWLQDAATLLTAAGIKYQERTQSSGLRTDLIVKGGRA